MVPWFDHFGRLRLKLGYNFEYFPPKFELIYHHKDIFYILNTFASSWQCSGHHFWLSLVILGSIPLESFDIFLHRCIWFWAILFGWSVFNIWIFFSQISSPTVFWMFDIFVLIFSALPRKVDYGTVGMGCR